MQFTPQNPGIAPLHALGHGAARVGKRLVAVQTAQLDVLPVEHEASGRELRFAESDARGELVVAAIMARQFHGDCVELGCLQVPQLHRANAVEANVAMLSRAFNRRRHALDHLGAVAQFDAQAGWPTQRTIDIAAQRQRAAVFHRAHLRDAHVFQKGLRHHAQRHVAIDAAEGKVVDVVAEGRDVLALRGIEFNGNDIVGVVLEQLRDLEGERRVTALILFEGMPVDGHFGGGHGAGKIDEDALAFPCRQRPEVAAVGRDELEIPFVEAVPRQPHIGMRERDLLPLRVIEAGRFESFPGLAAEEPAAGHLVNAPRMRARGRGSLVHRFLGSGIERRRNESRAKDKCAAAELGISVLHESHFEELR